MSDEYTDSEDDFEFSESELSISENIETQELMSIFKKLGKFNKTKLASGFSENDHRAAFEALVTRLGDFYPIPILEMAVKWYRAKRSVVSNRLIEAMFEEGASKIIFKELGETWTKDYELNIKVVDKDAFYGWLEARGYGDIIKTEVKFDKSVSKEKIKAFTTWLLDQHVPFEKEEAIHHMTLKSNMRKIYELGLTQEAVNKGFVEITQQPVLKLSVKK